ncbi:MAG: methionyl-tRNA formyltransferase [Acidobacteriota bacterium]
MRPGLRIAYFGTPAFAVPSLERLLASAHEVVGVVTQPDRPRGRGQRVTPGPVKAVAEGHGLPVLQPARLARDAFDAPFTALGADLGVVAAYGRLLPDWLLAAPRLGMINVHASLLPRWRGAAPVQRAIMAGDTQTGVSIMRVVKALDAGPVLARAARPIGPDETSAEVERDLATLGASLLLDIVDALAAGPVPEYPQDETAVTYAARLTKEEALLDWRHPAADLHNRVRGLQPWPGAYTHLEGARVLVHRSQLPDCTVPGPPGTIAGLEPGGLRVACGDGRALDLIELQAEGRRVLPARDFVAGRDLAGRRLG